ncbi:MAG: MoaD/ThiS family protein [Gammaproteobacteria bacterium]|nr:MoaD/ThiS family protein [Gammaproteobacteria bacterium]
MNVTFKLFASLATYLPDDAKDNAVEIEVGRDTTPNQLIERFRLPEREVHLVLKNGVFLQPFDRNTPLEHQDVLAIWPPVAGG